MPAKKKAELVEEAEAAGVDVPEDATVPEIKEALAEADAPVTDLPTIDSTPDGKSLYAGPDIEVEAVEEDAGLPGTPVVADTEYVPLGEPHETDPEPSDVAGPDHEADGRSLPGTPA